MTRKKETLEEFEDRVSREQWCRDGCCGTCAHWEQGPHEWIGSCNITLPPMLRDLSTNTTCRADDSCSLWKSK